MKKFSVKAHMAVKVVCDVPIASFNGSHINHGSSMMLCVTLYVEVAKHFIAWHYG